MVYKKQQIDIKNAVFKKITLISNDDKKMQSIHQMETYPY